MKKIILPLFLAVNFIHHSCSTNKAEESNNASEWTSLFNGKDLEGWIPKIHHHETGENFANTFRVTDGVLQVNYGDYPDFNERYGHLRSEEHTSELQSRENLVCRLLLEKKN